MRPVNLIPPEERRGGQAPLRRGPLAYVVVAALAAVLVAVTAMVLVNNQVAEREAEVAKLEREDAIASAEAARLASYTQFQTMSEERTETVRSLADSRFDWERVMRELSRVLPDDVSLVNLEASASGEGAESSAPSLTLSGCAAGQEGVAGFVTALKDIDGVTRVGLQASQVGEESGGEGATTEVGAAAPSSGEACAGGGSTAMFEVLVAFDAAPVASEAAEAAVTSEEGTEGEG